MAGGRGRCEDRDGPLLRSRQAICSSPSRAGSISSRGRWLAVEGRVDVRAAGQKQPRISPMSRSRSVSGVAVETRTGFAAVAADAVCVHLVLELGQRRVIGASRSATTRTMGVGVAGDGRAGMDARIASPQVGREAGLPVRSASGASRTPGDQLTRAGRRDHIKPLSRRRTRCGRRQGRLGGKRPCHETGQARSARRATGFAGRLRGGVDHVDGDRGLAVRSRNLATSSSRPGPSRPVRPLTLPLFGLRIHLLRATETSRGRPGVRWRPGSGQAARRRVVLEPEQRTVLVNGVPAAIRREGHGRGETS